MLSMLADQTILFMIARERHLRNHDSQVSKSVEIKYTKNAK